MSEFLMDGCKLLWYPERLQAFLDGKRIMPITIDAGIHKACNIKCKYCYGVKQVKSPEFIRPDRLLLMAEDAAKAGIESIAIVGDGEPTMNKGLYPFVEKLNELGVASAVATNGLLLWAKQIETLTSCCTWLRFNISGINNYEEIMGASPGSFHNLKGIIEYAVAHKYNCTIGLQAVLIPEGFSEIVPLAQFAIDNGVDYLVIKQFSDGGEGMPIHFDMDEYTKAIDDLVKAVKMSTDKTKIIVKWKAMQDSMNITKNQKWEFDRCIDLPFLFQVSGDGGCYPCGYMFGNKEWCYGNLNEERLIDILHSDKYWNTIKKVSEVPLQQLCTGQCRHCFGLQFMDKLTKAYKGNLQEALIEISGGVEKYWRLINNPPAHIRFV